MKHGCNFLRLQGVSIFEQLQLEEALLRAGSGNWCIINTDANPAFVLGISEHLEKRIVLDKAQNIPIIRRFSGGGTVCIDPDTVFFSLILDCYDLCIHTHTQLMQWVHEFLQPVFIPHELKLFEHDFVIDNKKIGGNAQCFAHKRMVHHISFLWSWDYSLMDMLVLPDKQPEYRNQRVHHHFCNKISQYFLYKSAFIQCLEQQINKRFCCTLQYMHNVQTVLSAPHTRTVHFLGT